MRILLEIENFYELYDDVTTQTEADVLPWYDGENEEGEDWPWSQIFPLTGTGQTKGNSWYVARVLECDDEELVGAEFEFGF